MSAERGDPGEEGGEDGSFGFAPMIDTIAAESRRLAAVVGETDLEAASRRAPNGPCATWPTTSGWCSGTGVRTCGPRTRTGARAASSPRHPRTPTCWRGSGGAPTPCSALREAGPDAPCWAWWPSPHTSGAVGRHQAQEAAVHRWDAEGVGGPRAAASRPGGRRRPGVRGDHDRRRPLRPARVGHTDRDRHRSQLAGRRGGGGPLGPGVGAAGDRVGPGPDALPAPPRPRRRGGRGPHAGGGAPLLADTS